MSRYLAVPQFDGPSDTRERSGSQSSQGHRSQGSQSRSAAPSSHAPSQGTASRPPSNAGSSRGPPVGYPAATGRDPGRDEPVLSPEEEHRYFSLTSPFFPRCHDANIFCSLQVAKRVDLPAEAFSQGRGEQHQFAVRPGLGKAGKPINLRVNQFRVSGLPDFDVHQYDVSLSPAPLKVC